MTLVTGRATTCVLLVGLDGSVGTSKKGWRWTWRMLLKMHVLILNRIPAHDCKHALRHHESLNRTKALVTRQTAILQSFCLAFALRQLEREAVAIEIAAGALSSPADPYQRHSFARQVTLLV